MSGTAVFEGTVELTGYISINPEDDRGLFAGDVIFVPSDCECLIPVMGYRLDPDVGIVHFPRLNTKNGMYWENDYNYIYLGNTADMIFDISAVPEDGSFVKTAVTLDNIKLTCGIGMMERCSADIVSLEIL